MFRRSVSCLGRKTEFLQKLKLISEGMEQKKIEKKFWSQVYTEECVMKASGQEVTGLEGIVHGMPSFHKAFDVETNIVDVLGDEEADRFAVHFKHSVRFVGEYGQVQVFYYYKLNLLFFVFFYYNSTNKTKQIQPTGSTGTFEGVTIHKVNEEGKTTEIVQSIDLLSYFIQVGAISPMILAPTEKPQAPDSMDGAGTVKIGGVKEI